MTSNLTMNKITHRIPCIFSYLYIFIPSDLFTFSQLSRSGEAHHKVNCASQKVNTVAIGCEGTLRSIAHTSQHTYTHILTHTHTRTHSLVYGYIQLCFQNKFCLFFRLTLDQLSISWLQQLRFNLKVTYFYHGLFYILDNTNKFALVSNSAIIFVSFSCYLPLRPEQFLHNYTTSTLSRGSSYHSDVV